jgi:hypothetical protein
VLRKSVWRLCSNDMHKDIELEDFAFSVKRRNAPGVLTL